MDDYPANSCAISHTAFLFYWLQYLVSWSLGIQISTHLRHIIDHDVVTLTQLFHHHGGIIILKKKFVGPRSILWGHRYPLFQTSHYSAHEFQSQAGPVVTCILLSLGSTIPRVMSGCRDQASNPDHSPQRWAWNHRASPTQLHPVFDHYRIYLAMVTKPWSPLHEAWAKGYCLMTLSWTPSACIMCQFPACCF